MYNKRALTIISTNMPT